MGPSPAGIELQVCNQRASCEHRVLSDHGSRPTPTRRCAHCNGSEGNAYLRVPEFYQSSLAWGRGHQVLDSRHVGYLLIQHCECMRALRTLMCAACRRCCRRRWSMCMNTGFLTSVSLTATAANATHTGCPWFHEASCVPEVRRVAFSHWFPCCELGVATVSCSGA